MNPFYCVAVREAQSRCCGATNGLVSFGEDGIPKQKGPKVKFPPPLARLYNVQWTQLLLVVRGAFETECILLIRLMDRL